MLTGLTTDCKKLKLFLIEKIFELKPSIITMG